MVWGGIRMDGRAELYVVNGGTMTAVRYRDEVLQPIVRPGAIGQDFVLMQAIARPHTAIVAMA